jgi:site-specific DNA recombinase
MTGEHQVMGARRGDFDRGPRLRLADDIGEVGFRPVDRLAGADPFRESCRAVEPGLQLTQRAHPEHLDTVDQAGFGEVVHGHHHRLPSIAAGSQRRGQHTADGAHATVERQFAQQHCLFQTMPPLLAAGREHRAGQRDSVVSSSTVINMQAAIYTRISKDREGAGLGVERQRADCAELAEQLGWTIVGTYSDNDISAYSGRTRPGYDDMCTALELGRAQAVIAWHADRLHRRPLELESFIDLCDRKGIEVRTVRSGTVDLSTASGKMIARMLGAAARHEVEHSVERQKRAKKQAALDGKFRGGRRAFGYELDGMKVRPAEAEAIRQAAEKVLSGASLSQIARDWNAIGLRTSYGGVEFTSREVRKILLRPRNAGIALHEGKHAAVGEWENILDADTFAALEALLRDPARLVSLSYERKYQGSGVYVCGKCGAVMRVGTHNRGAQGWRRTYVCSASKHLGRDAEHLDAYIDEIVIGRLSLPDAAIALGGDGEHNIGALHLQREGLRARLDELGALFGAGDIDGAQLKRGTAELRARLDGVEAQIAAARTRSAVANLVLAGDDLTETWMNSPPDIRGRVIGALMTVSVLPTRRGRKPGGAYFDPAEIRIEWKHA